MTMEAHGREFYAIPSADGVYVPVKYGAGVSFLCFLAGAVGDTYTLQEARDAAGTGAQNLATVERYWTANGVGGAWTLRTQAAAATVITAAAATQNGMVVEVEEAELSAGYTYIKLTSTGAGLVTALVRDLKTSRRPDSVPAFV